MDKLKYIRLEREDGSYSGTIPLSVDPDYIEINGSNLTTVINEKADSHIVNEQIDALQNEISSVASGSPAGIYTTVAALTSADPDHSKIYIVSENGNWYYYNNNTWISGGIYQATEDSVTITQLEEKISLLTEKTNNLCPFVKFLPYTNLNNNTGVYTVSDASINTNASDVFIPITPGETYVFWRDGEEHNLTYYIFLYDINKNFIREVHAVNAPVYITSGTTEYYARLKINRGNSTVIVSKWTGWMFEKSPKSSSFEPSYQVLIPESSVSTSKIENEAIITSKINDKAVTPEKTDFFSISENLWRGSFVAYSNLNVNTGVYNILNTNINTAASEQYISVDEEEYYSFKCNCPVSYTLDWYFYDEYYNFISHKSGYVVKTEPRTKYLRIKLYSSNNTEQLALSTNMDLRKSTSIPTDYIAPYVLPWSYIDDEGLKEEVEDIISREGDSASLKIGKELLDEVRPIVFNYNKNNKFLNFAFITDTHVNGIHHEGDYIADNNIEIFKLLCNEKWLDFGAFGGDIYTAYNHTHDEALQILDRAMQKFGEIQIPFYMTKGNHDCNAKYIPLADLDELDWNSNVYYIFDEDNSTYTAIQENEWDGETPLHVGVKDNNERITNYQYYMLCNKNTNDDNNIVFNNNDPFGNYYYRDFNKEGIRVIILNAYDSQNLEDLGYHDPQITWLRDVALNTDKKVIFFTHMYTGNSEADINKTIRRFINNGGTVIGMIHGDRHQDVYTNLKYNVIGVGAGYGKDSNIGTKNEFLFSIFTIDTVNNMIYETRIGRGHSREFSFEGDGSEIIS